MNYTFRMDEQTQTVVVAIPCILLTLEIRKEILLGVARSLKNFHFTKVLIDLTAASCQQDEPMTGALELVNFMRTLGIPPHTKLAFVCPETNEYRHYFEDVAQIDGWNLQYFPDPQTATTWLAHPRAD